MRERAEDVVSIAAKVRLLRVRMSKTKPTHDGAEDDLLTTFVQWVRLRRVYLLSQLPYYYALGVRLASKKPVNYMNLRRIVSPLLPVSLLLRLLPSKPASSSQKSPLTLHE